MAKVVVGFVGMDRFLLLILLIGPHWGLHIDQRRLGRFGKGMDVDLSGFLGFKRSKEVE